MKNSGHKQGPLPRVLGGFEIVAPLGQGGMGTVYKAVQTSLDRVVAVKVLKPEIARNPGYLPRFQREARTCAKLNHPNIVQGIAAGKDEKSGLWYFAMEYVPGPSAQDLLDRHGYIPERRALRITLEIARALEYAHRHGIIHRDIKPENILIDQDGRAKLADLGLAKQTLEDDPSLTQSGQSVGTPYYMSPEQIRGGAEKIDARADLYALGGTLFHLVTGRPPFDGESPQDIMAQHLNERPPNARRTARHVSDYCSRLIERMLKPLEQRLASARELVAVLEQALPDDPAPLGKEIDPAEYDLGPSRHRLATPFAPNLAPLNLRLSRIGSARFKPVRRQSKIPWVLLCGLGIITGIALRQFLASTSEEARNPRFQPSNLAARDPAAAPSGLPGQAPAPPAFPNPPPNVSPKAAKPPDHASVPESAPQASAPPDPALAPPSPLGSHPGPVPARPGNRRPVSRPDEPSRTTPSTPPVPSSSLDYPAFFREFSSRLKQADPEGAGTLWKRTHAADTEKVLAPKLALDQLALQWLEELLNTGPWMLETLQEVENLTLVQSTGNRIQLGTQGSGTVREVTTSGLQVALKKGQGEMTVSYATLLPSSRLLLGATAIQDPIRKAVRIAFLHLLTLPELPKESDWAQVREEFSRLRGDSSATAELAVLEHLMEESATLAREDGSRQLLAELELALAEKRWKKAEQAGERLLKEGSAVPGLPERAELERKVELAKNAGVLKEVFELALREGAPVPLVDLEAYAGTHCSLLLPRGTRRNQPLPYLLNCAAGQHCAIRFALRASEGGFLPEQFEVLEAKLRLAPYNGFPVERVELQELESPWAAGEANLDQASAQRNWKNKGGDVAGQPCAEVRGTRREGKVEWCEFEVSDSLRKQLQAGKSYGWRIRAIAKEGAPNPQGGNLSFLSPTSTYLDLRPTLLLKIRSERPRPVLPRKVAAGSELPAPLRSLFKGSVERFNPETLEVQLGYSFEDPAELEDWNYSQFNSQERFSGRATVQEGHLCLEPDGRTLLFKAVFESASLSLEIPARPRDGSLAITLCDTGTGSYYALYLSLQNGKANLSRISPGVSQKLCEWREIGGKVGEPLGMQASYAAQKLKGQVGGELLEATDPRFGKGLLGIRALSSQVRCAQIRLAGRLDPAWLREVLEKKP